ncbi:MAG: DUF6265 family protein [Pseudomonadota bacterium]
MDLTIDHFKKCATALALALCAGLLQAQAPAKVEQLAWLAGCWAAVGGEAGSGEHWMAPVGGTMLGVGRTVRGGATREHEFMQLRDTPDGIVFIALPSGQTETRFAAERIGLRAATFHNPAHDFPQRVIYESPDSDTLDARIEGQRNGQLRTIRFPMKRAGCPIGVAR